VTGCELTKAAGSDAMDGAVGVELRERDDTLTAADGPVQVLADSAYGTGDALAAILGVGHIPLVKPWPTKPAVPGGLHIDEGGGLTIFPDRRQKSTLELVDLVRYDSGVLLQVYRPVRTP
jgi:hypothetical protein